MANALSVHQNSIILKMVNALHAIVCAQNAEDQAQIIALNVDLAIITTHIFMLA